MKKTVFLFSIIFLINIFYTFSQGKLKNIYDDNSSPNGIKVIDSIITNAPFIFSGRLERENITQFIKDSATGIFYQSLLIRIDKIFKGESLNEGTVEVIFPIEQGGFNLTDKRWGLYICNTINVKGQFVEKNNNCLTLYGNNSDFRSLILERPRINALGLDDKYYSAFNGLLEFNNIYSVENFIIKRFKYKPFKKKQLKNISVGQSNLSTYYTSNEEKNTLNKKYDSIKNVMDEISKK